MYPSFSHSQQLKSLFGGGCNATVPQQTMPTTNVDLSVQTTQQIATMQAKPGNNLGLEYISQCPGPGGQSKLTDAEYWKIINLANEVFAFNGWSGSITSLAIDYVCAEKKNRSG